MKYIFKPDKLTFGNIEIYRTLNGTSFIYLKDKEIGFYKGRFFTEVVGKNNFPDLSLKVSERHVKRYGHSNYTFEVNYPQKIKKNLYGAVFEGKIKKVFADINLDRLVVLTTEKRYYLISDPDDQDNLKIDDFASEEITTENFDNIKYVAFQHGSDYFKYVVFEDENGIKIFGDDMEYEDFYLLHDLYPLKLTKNYSLTKDFDKYNDVIGDIRKDLRGYKIIPVQHYYNPREFYRLENSKFLGFFKDGKVRLCYGQRISEPLKILPIFMNEEIPEHTLKLDLKDLKFNSITIDNPFLILISDYFKKINVECD